MVLTYPGLSVETYPLTYVNVALTNVMQRLILFSCCWLRLMLYWLILYWQLITQRMNETKVH